MLLWHSSFTAYRDDGTDIMPSMNPASLVDWIDRHGPPATVLTAAAIAIVADLAWAYLDRAKPEANNEDAVKAHARRRRTRIIAGGIAGTITLVVLLVWAPWWVEGHHLRDDKGQLVSSAGIIITGFRTMLLALAVGGFTAAGLYYTREKHRLEREQFQHAQDQFAESQKQFETTLRETQQRDQKQTELTREGQVTGRYVEAIKLLASKELHERLGGIYSLERIMKDSARDRTTVVEVLAAFARTRLDGNAPELRPDVVSISGDGTNLVVIQSIAEDIRAALDVLGRNWGTHHGLIDLRSVNLREWDARELNLTGARLTGAVLPDALLEGVLLDDADLRRAQLPRAHLVDSRMRRVDLREAVLTGADLEGADLQGAKLNGANFESASLIGANLDHAILPYVGKITAGQLCSAAIYKSTTIPEVLAQDPRVQGRIQACEEARTAGKGLPHHDPAAHWTDRG
ncbi:pentapeptide repeat-containing protein [Streptomyces sp. NBC_00715]|uniref:pentapeptide repeat-containing protein n=1 Tax=Streptomyces sp. NBC_00715 TaxID=2975811 RepID=UPI003865DADB